jgi:hypothetical protein
MKNTKLIVQGLCVAIGLFLANAVVLPLASELTLRRGLLQGAIGGVLVMIVYFVPAQVKPESGSGKTKAPVASE